MLKGKEISLRRLRYFLAAFEHGTVTRASRTLGLAPGTVSVQLAALENELGTSFFERTPRGLVARGAAERVYRLAAPLVDELDFLIRYVQIGNMRRPKDLLIWAPFAMRGSAIRYLLDACTMKFGKRSRWLADSDPPAEHVAIEYRIGGGHTSQATRMRDRWVGIEVPAADAWPRCARAAIVLRGVSIHDRRFLLEMRRVLRDAPKLLTPREIDPVALGTASDSGSTNLVGLVPLTAMPKALLSEAYDVAVMPSSEYDPLAVVEIRRPPRSSLERADVLRDIIGELARSWPRAKRTGDSRLKRKQTFDVSVRGLRYFAAVYEEGRIGVAAERLHVVQPAVSMLVSKLEGWLGARLFYRTARGVRPTANASLLYELTRPVLQDLEDLDKQFTSASVGPRPLVRVGIIPALNERSMLAKALADALHAWTAQNAQVQLRVVEAYGTELRRLVRNGMLDLAILYVKEADSDLTFDVISTEPMVVVTDASRRLLGEGPVTLRDIANLPLILPSERHGIRTLLDGCFHRAKIPLTPKLEVDSIASALRLIRAQPYATVLPISAIFAGHRKAGYALNPIEHPRLRRSIAIATNRASQPPEARQFSKLFSAALQRALSQIPSMISSVAEERLA